MAEKLTGKFAITVKGETKPIFATQEQWREISSKLKDGTVSITTNEGKQEVFAILEIARGYSGKGLATETDGVMMLFTKEEVE